MRRYSFSFGIIFLFFIMLFFPQEVFSGASDGLLLWFQIVLPTLLPFIILSSLLIQTNSISFISRILGPVLKRIFHISTNGSFAVLAGFLCGYPMGAKVTSDLILSGRITKEEGKYLLSFCNNTSPMFIISYVICQNVKEERLVSPSLFFLFFSPILCSFLFRYFYRSKELHPGQLPMNCSEKLRFDFQTLDFCIMNGFETITKVGGYIILFSVFLSLLNTIQTNNRFIEYLALPMLEITNGIPILANSSLPFSIKYSGILGLTSFGGFCSVAQTKSMIQEAGLPILPYILEKLITALVTSLFAFLYITHHLQ